MPPLQNTQINMGSRHFWIEGPAFEKASLKAQIEYEKMVDEAVQKDNAMNFKTHNHESINIDHTFFQGEIEATYSQICSIFGRPLDGDGYKVQAEWNVKFKDGTVATIYDWKVGYNYLGDEGIPPEDIVIWHVSGMEPTAVDRVEKALQI